MSISRHFSRLPRDAARSICVESLIFCLPGRCQLRPVEYPLQYDLLRGGQIPLPFVTLIGERYRANCLLEARRPVQMAEFRDLPEYFDGIGAKFRIRDAMKPGRHGRATVFQGALHNDAFNRSKGDERSTLVPPNCREIIG